jgi:hypothetical protein
MEDQTELVNVGIRQNVGFKSDFGRISCRPNVHGLEIGTVASNSALAKGASCTEPRAALRQACALGGSPGSIGTTLLTLPEAAKVSLTCVRVTPSGRQAFEALCRRAKAALMAPIVG